MSGNKTRLEVVAQILDCEACSLWKEANSPVPFSGPVEAKIAVVGEAPGAQEDKACKPFIGPAGEYLREKLTEAGFDTNELAFINTVSCFPFGTPTPENVAACAPNKRAQIELIEPEWVLLVGNVAIKAVYSALGVKHGRGRPFVIDGQRYFATYHPSAVLRDGRLSKPFGQDLKAFAELTRLSEWSSAIPDACSACPVDAIWIEDTGLGWCEVHMPADERRKYDARMALIQQDYEEAKARRDAKNTCPYCGRVMFGKGKLGPSRDHMVPVSRLRRNGITLNGNVIMCCSDCNGSKNDFTPAEWLEQLEKEVEPGELTLIRIEKLRGLRGTLRYFSFPKTVERPGQEPNISADDYAVSVVGSDWRKAVEAGSAAQGMDMAETGADSDWMDRAWGVLVGYLRSHQEFFVDDFWAHSGLERPRESRALGPLVNRAAREGLMEKSGVFRKSTASNQTEKPVWTSRAYAA